MPVAQLREAAKFLAGELLPAGNSQREKIDFPLALDHLEMEMRSGRMAGLTDIADDIPLGDPITPSQPRRDTGEVPIARRVSVSMGDFYEIAVIFVPAGELDRAPADAHHRGSGSRRVVDGQVRPDRAQDRMHAPNAVVGRDSAIIERRAQKRAAQRAAVVIEIAILSCLRGV